MAFLVAELPKRYRSLEQEQELLCTSPCVTRAGSRESDLDQALDPDLVIACETKHIRVLPPVFGCGSLKQASARAEPVLPGTQGLEKCIGDGAHIGDPIGGVRDRPLEQVRALPKHGGCHVVLAAEMFVEGPARGARGVEHCLDAHADKSHPIEQVV